MGSSSTACQALPPAPGAVQVTEPAQGPRSTSHGTCVAGGLALHRHLPAPGPEGTRRPIAMLIRNRPSHPARAAGLASGQSFLHPSFRNDAGADPLHPELQGREHQCCAQVPQRAAQSPGTQRSAEAYPKNQKQTLEPTSPHQLRALFAAAEGISCLTAHPTVPGQDPPVRGTKF